MYAIKVAALIISTLFGFSVSAVAQDAPSLADITEAWLASRHAEQDAKAFTHWNDDGEIPENCATCHSGPGFRDFIGSDGSAAGVVDHPAPLGSFIDCAACHNAAASSLDAVTFPSGVTITGTGTSAVCTVCHQGRSSGDQVTASLADLDEDAVSADIAFLNVHYRAAAATLYGGAVRGGYQYEGKVYADRFAHVPTFDNCTACHSPHSLEVKVEQCTACHKDISSLAAIRTTPADLDGDGNTTEGVAAEISTLHEQLANAITAYASEITGAPIIYDAHAYPYFFNDTNANGSVDGGEAIFPNRYQSWTPRLLRAAYNYQFIAKDPGAYAHNPKYATQLLHDSLENLGEKVNIDLTNAVRP